MLALAVCCLLLTVTHYTYMYVYTCLFTSTIVFLFRWRIIYVFISPLLRRVSRHLSLHTFLLEGAHVSRYVRAWCLWDCPHRFQVEREKNKIRTTALYIYTTKLPTPHGVRGIILMYNKRVSGKWRAQVIKKLDILANTVYPQLLGNV